MCDTLTALASETARGAALFAKNSDRERNEAQVVEMHPARRGDPAGRVKLTYVDIPDVAQTHAVLLSRPFWMWGAEMGANEHGVVIGNEALHARRPAQRRRALTGMDLLRLGLERAASAKAAVEVMIELLEIHGQGGDCGHLGRFYYNNGFIVADADEAYVLETERRRWVVERVTGRRALSNAYSIGAGYSAISPDLAVEGPPGRPFDVAAHLLDEARDAVSFGRGRCARGQALLDAKAGRLAPADMMAILRDHGTAADWSPANTVGRTICMHAAEGPRRSQSVGSMVSELRPERTVHWLTGTSAPCLSVFKPVVFGAGLPASGPTPSDQADAANLWWRHERLHRAALRDHAAAHAVVAEERNALEADFRARMDEASDADLAAVAAGCWRDAEVAEARWTTAVEAIAKGANPAAYGRSWGRLNRAAGF